MPDTSEITLSVRLLGGFSLNYRGEANRSIDKARAQSLLAFLTLHAGEPQPRAHLAFTFWPDSEEKQALAEPLLNLLL